MNKVAPNRCFEISSLLLKTVNESQWVALVLHPRTRVAISMSGLPFRFVSPQNWDTQEIRLAEHLIYFVASGRCRVVVGGKKLTLGAGDLCWVCPGVSFRFFTEPGDISPVLRRFRMNVSQDGEAVRLKWDCRVFRDASEAVEWARTLVAEPDQVSQAGQTGHGGLYTLQRAASLAALFSISLFEGGRRSSPEPGLPQRACRRISRYVLDRAGERITPATLARLAGFSPDYFSRLFRKSFGTSPREWLLKQRLHYAASLLSESEWRVSEVASRLGYPDLYLFSRQFKKEFGSSPRAWREANARIVDRQE